MVEIEWNSGAQGGENRRKGVDNSITCVEINSREKRSLNGVRKIKCD
jgi:hypothetical protein